VRTTPLFLTAASLFAVVISLPAAASATTIFTNFPGVGSGSVGFCAAGPAGGCAPDVAEKFTTDAAYNFSSLQLSLGGNAAFTLELLSDNGAGKPGAILETWTGTAPDPLTLLTFDDQLGLQLEADKTYWAALLVTDQPVQTVRGGGLVMYSPDVDTTGWVGPSGAINSFAFTASGEAISSAPEPGSLFLFGGALAGLSSIVRKRRRNNLG
jgi:hypothetical protein